MVHLFGILNERNRIDWDKAMDVFSEYYDLVIKLSGYTHFFIDARKINDTTITIDNISCYRRGNGIASRCMNLFIELADKHGMVLELEVGPDYDIGGDGEVMDGGELMAWYNRLGFVWEDGYMSRNPQKNA
tara:strand:+ start:207 stop:599 length:393 start_codon:yes stop_codon:yes gene_type:complete